jgi:hypothetical protein
MNWESAACPVTGADIVRFHPISRHPFEGDEAVEADSTPRGGEESRRTVNLVSFSLSESYSHSDTHPS